MKRQHEVTTKYSIKLADLSCDSKLILSKSDEKKLNKFFEKRQFFYPYELYITIDMNIKDAIFKNFKNLKELRATFRTNEDCKKFMEYIIWEGEPTSPYDETSKVYECGDGWYKCKNTGKEFNILTGTLFQNTKIDLPTWFEIIFREHSDKGGLAATTVMRDYGISYATAWHMLQKIRNAMGFENHQKLSGTVEVDEYYAGGVLKNMNYGKKLEVKKKPYQNKKPAQGFVERGGNLVINVVKDLTESTLNAGVLRYVEPGSTLYSDDNPSYLKLPPLYKRGIVIHSKGNYVDKEDNNIYTNTIESGWAGLKRTEDTHIKISLKHFQNYANETVFRYNLRKMDSGSACIWLLLNMQGTNITWRQIRDGEYTRYNRNKTRVA